MSHRLHPTKNKKLPPDAPKKWYYIEYYPLGAHAGISRNVFYGTAAEAAEADRVHRQQVRKTPVNVNPQFCQVTADFIDWYKIESRPRTVESAELHIKHLSTIFHMLPLGAIPGMIEHYKKKRLAEGVKPITINKELNTLSVIFKYAVEKDLMGEAPKIKRFPGKMTKSPVPIMPSYEEMKAVVNEVRKEVRGIVMLEFYAGLRRAESHNLQAEDVLLDRRMIIIEGKGGKQRIVPIANDELFEELKSRKEAVKSGYLWIYPVTKKPYKRIDDSIKNAAVRLGYNGRWYHHLFRHGFGTTAIESGINLRSVQGLMGHSTSRTTEIYTHLAAAHLIKEMEKWGK